MSGLQYYDLTGRWEHGMPEWPSSPGVNVFLKKMHARDGYAVSEIDAIMHRGTHMDAPLHVTEGLPPLGGYPLWRFFGTGVAVSIPKQKWGVITPEDLEQARPEIQPGDIVMINTGRTVCSATTTTITHIHPVSTTRLRSGWWRET